MKHFQLSKLLFLFSMTCMAKQVTACSCPGIPTTEQAYKRSELVITGRIIGMDTVNRSNTLLFDRYGTKIGKHKYSLYIEKFVRVKFLIEKNLKPSTILPDTIYVLTEAECGVYFFPYLGDGYIDNSAYEYIIYGDKWIEKSIEKVKTGRKNLYQIKSTTKNNIFYTSRCRRTQHKNEEELTKLAALKN